MTELAILEIITYVVIFILVIIVHELGHYYSAKLMRLESTKIDWLKLRVDTHAHNKTEAILFLTSAIVVGFIPFLLISNIIVRDVAMLSYFFGGCYIDIVNIIKIFGMKSAEQL